MKDFETLKLWIVSFSSVRSRYSCAEFGRESYLPWWEDNGYREWEWDSERRENKNRDWKRGSTAADSGMHCITQPHDFFFLKNIASVTCRCPDSCLNVLHCLRLMCFSLCICRLFSNRLFLRQWHQQWLSPPQLWSNQNQ